MNMNTKPLVCIDAGHGGRDSGACNMRDPARTDDDLYEKHLTLQLAFTLKSAFERDGWRAMLTRESDIAIPLMTRVRIANEGKANLFVSLHWNAAVNKKAVGFEVYHDNNSARGKSMAEYVCKEFSRKYPDRKVRGVFPDNQSQHTDLTVLSRTAMPAILVESGFISNDEEADWTLKNMTGIAECIVKGMQAFYNAWKVKPGVITSANTNS